MKRKWLSFVLSATCCGSMLATVSLQTAHAQQRRGRVTTLDGFDAVRGLYNRRNYAEAEQFAYPLLWQTMERPGVLDLLSKCLKRQDRPEEAAAYLTFFHRVLVKSGTAGDKKKYLLSTQRRLKTLNREYEKRVAKYLETAPGKQFVSPEAVEDLWMTQVSTELLALRTLEAWKLNGGKPDVSPDWIHNRQGVIHRSGMKLVDDVEGRNGVLFSVPFKEESDWVKHWGHPLQISTHNPGKCRFLRVGARGYGATVVLRAVVGGTEIETVKVDKKSWHDLKIDLKDRATEDEVFLQLIAPADRPYRGGIWIDYLDFFDS